MLQVIYSLTHYSLYIYLEKFVFLCRVIHLYVEFKVR
jgi:hypothetical protein